MDSRQRLLGLLRRHGWNSTSFQVLEPECHYWFDAEGDAAVAYLDTGFAWVAAGAPIAPIDRCAGVTQRFAEEARRRGRRIVFFATEPRFLRCAPMRSLAIGEQPSWGPARLGRAAPRPSQSEGTVAARTREGSCGRARSVGRGGRSDAPATGAAHRAMVGGAGDASNVLSGRARAVRVSRRAPVLRRARGGQARGAPHRGPGVRAERLVLRKHPAGSAFSETERPN